MCIILTGFPLGRFTFTQGRFVRGQSENGETEKGEMEGGGGGWFLIGNGWER